MEYSTYNFDGINIEDSKFKEGSILPADTEFFQRILHKSIGSCVLPTMDYSTYNFDGVWIEGSNLIKFICRDIHKYKLNQFKVLDFSCSSFDGLMSEEQANLIKLAYPERISEKSIILPNVLQKEYLANRLTNEMI